MSTPLEPTDNLDTIENAIELKDVEGLSQGQIVRRRFFRHRGALIGLLTIVLVAILAYSSIGFAGTPGWWKWNHFTPGEVQNGGSPTLSLPTWLGGSGFAIGDHPFGQDEIGRDTFARTMKGTQTSLNVMIIISLLSALIGMVIGAVSGYFRGGTDQALMRFTDLFITFPVVVIGAVLGNLAGSAGAFWLAVALGCITWTTLARLVRGEFLTLREREFVDAAKVAGASSFRIIRKHMIPNAMGVIIVNTTLLASTAVLLETALSYLGFGIKAPDVSLGTMISQYQSAFSTRPWLFWWPGLFIIIIALSVNFIGDGLRDAFDPRQKRVPSARKMARAAVAADRAKAEDRGTDGPANRDTQ
jgi:peptide/nickel transport system permease protein